MWLCKVKKVRGKISAVFLCACAKLKSGKERSQQYLSLVVQSLEVERKDLRYSSLVVQSKEVEEKDLSSVSLCLCRVKESRRKISVISLHGCAGLRS